MTEAQWRHLFTSPEPLTASALTAWLADMAQRLLNGCRLRAGQTTFRLTEVEAYYHAPAHPDPFVHAHPLQQECGRWYFHRTAGGYRSGSFQGLDVTFGDGRGWGGWLIRGLETENGQRIDGPSRSVDHLLRATATIHVAELDEQIAARPIWEPSNRLTIEWQPLTERCIETSPRVGLTLNRQRSEAAQRFVMRRYRFVTEPRRLTKGKVLLAAALLAEGLNAVTVAQRIGLPLRSVQRYADEVRVGREAADFTVFHGRRLSSRDLCRLYGTWLAHEERVPSTNSHESFMSR